MTHCKHCEQEIYSNKGRWFHRENDNAMCQMIAQPMVDEVHYTHLLKYVENESKLYIGQGRWSIRFRIVYRDPVSKPARGFEYQEPATELQDFEDEDYFPEIDYITGMVPVYEVQHETRQARVAVDSNGRVWDVNVL